MGMKKPLLLFIGFGSVLSCQKDEGIPPPKGWDWFGTHDAKVYNYVLVSGNQVTNKADSNDYQISVAAAFIDSNSNKLQGVSDLLVNQRGISRAVDNSYNFGYNNTPFFDEGLSLFGSEVTIKIKGFAEADTLTESVYLPKRVVKWISDFPDFVDHSKDLNLSWETDELNPWGNVIIQAYYYPGLSQINDSSLPKEIQPLNITTPDNGNYTISVNDLLRFPVHSYIGISIARGTQVVSLLPISHKRIFFFSSSSASTPPLLVSNSKEP